MSPSVAVEASDVGRTTVARVLGGTVSYSVRRSPSRVQALRARPCSESWAASAWVMGVRPADDSTPCQRCQVYQSRRANEAWVTPEDLIAPHTPGRRMNRLIDCLPHPGLAAIARRLHAGSRTLLTRVP